MAKSVIKLADVAKAADVSQGTASNVFSRPDIVRPEVRERVLAAAAELGYRGPDLKGRLLRAGKVNAIGVATEDPMSYFFNDPYARTLLASISKTCDARGAGLSLVSAQNAQKASWNIHSALVDGFILLCVEGGERLVSLTRERQLPFVALALGSLDQTIPAIGIDNFDGAKQAASHIAALGHRQIAIIGTELGNCSGAGLATREQVGKAIYSTSRLRGEGYWTGLAEAGIDPDTVPFYETRNSAATLMPQLETLFDSANPPTALLVMSDKMALLAMNWLRARGLSVPGDVSIVGFDGIAEGARAQPRLSTVVQPIAEIGRRAVLSILDGDGPEGREMMAVSLLVRGTTAPPK